MAIVAGVTLMANDVEIQRWMSEVHHWVMKAGKWLYLRLDELPGITPYPSATNFLLIKGEDSLLHLNEEMARKRILLRDCRSFVELGECWLRIGLQERLGNRKIVNALGNCLANN